MWISTLWNTILFYLNLIKMFKIIYFVVMVNWTSFCCGQNKTLVYVILGFGKP